MASKESETPGDAEMNLQEDGAAKLRGQDINLLLS